jgi:hypothetical protein
LGSGCASGTTSCWHSSRAPPRRAHAGVLLCAQHFDNSRLVKAPDPVRVREMRLFLAAIAVLFSLVMVYGLQHFYAIEGGYRVESEKLAVEQLREDNRQLRLAEAQLTQPGASTRWRASWALPSRRRDRWFIPTRGRCNAAPVLAQVTPPAAPPASVEAELSVAKLLERT